MRALKFIKIKQRIIRALRPCLIALFLAVIGYSLFRIWDTDNNYVKERNVREQMSRYRPSNPAPVLQTGGEDKAPEFVNQNIVEAQKINPDIVGWITLDGSRIDYPFVQSEDNEYYLRRDINGDYSYAGTVFMDYRHDVGFSDFSSVIYGHNMENGTMFSDLIRYDSADFFAANQTGYLYLSHAAYRLEIFAYMALRSDDNLIYGAGTMDDFDRRRLLTYIEENALRYRDLSLTVSDRLVALSTCTNSSNEARSVLISRLVRIA